MANLLQLQINMVCFVKICSAILNTCEVRTRQDYFVTFWTTNEHIEYWGVDVGGATIIRHLKPVLRIYLYKQNVTHMYYIPYNRKLPNFGQLIATLRIKYKSLYDHWIISLQY